MIPKRTGVIGIAFKRPMRHEEKLAKATVITPDSHHILLAPAFAMAISPKSNLARRSLAMSSSDLAGAPKNISKESWM